MHIHSIKKVSFDLTQEECHDIKQVKKFSFKKLPRFLNSPQQSIKLCVLFI